MEERLYNLFKSEREVLKAILEYFSLKNKVLWEGTWESGSKTIKDISKYQTLMAHTWLGTGTVILARRGDYFYGGTAVGYPAWMATASFQITVSGDTATLNEAQYLSHNRSAGHGAISTGSLLKIIGIDPILPDALKNIIGGAVQS